MLESKWHWREERDGIVIRADDLENSARGDYVAEIDTKYLKPDELKAAEAVADEIILLHNTFIKTKGEMKKLFK